MPVNPPPPKAPPLNALRAFEAAARLGGFARAAEDLAVTIPRGQSEGLEASLDMSNAIKAPLTRGQALGQVIVSLNGEQVKAVPLVALDDVPEGSLFKRIWDQILLFFSSLFS